MSDFQDSNRGLMPPTANSGVYSPQTLSGTGTAESHNTNPFTKGRVYMLTVGAEPIRVLFSGTAGAANVVPATGGAILNAGSSFTFRAFTDSVHVYVEAADGASAYQASVWQRES